MGHGLQVADQDEELTFCFAMMTLVAELTKTRAQILLEKLSTDSWSHVAPGLLILYNQTSYPTSRSVPRVYINIPKSRELCK